MKLYTLVKPNYHNDHGYNFVIYWKLWIFRFELGRVSTIQQLMQFSEQYEQRNDKPL